MALWVNIGLEESEIIVSKRITKIVLKYFGNGKESWFFTEFRGGKYFLDPNSKWYCLYDIKIGYLVL